MKIRTTLILLLAGIAAVLLFVLVEQPRHARRENRALRETRFTDVPAESVHAVTIVRPDVTISARRENGRWILISPVADTAEEAAVNVLLSSIENATIERRLAGAGSNPGEYGLDPPAAIVRLAGKRDEFLLETRVGDFNVAKSACYAAAGGGGDVVLIDADVRRFALRPLFEFRNKRIVDVAVEDVDRIDIIAPRSSMSWEARVDGTWETVEDGDTIRGDRTVLESVVRRLRALRADEIPLEASADPDPYLSPKAGTIRLRLEGDSVFVETTFGGRRAGRCYVSSSQNHRVARVDTTVLYVFAWTVDDARDRRLLTFDGQALSRITVEGPGKSVTVVRSDAGWAFSNPVFGRLDQETVARFLFALEGLRFDAVIEESAPAANRFGFEAPRLRVTLFDRDDRVVDSLVVGSSMHDGPLRYVTSRSSGVLASVSRASLGAVEDLLPGSPAE